MSNDSRPQPAFTLVEVLTVIAIVGILAALTLTVIPAVIKSAKIRKARIQMADLVNGIQSYDSVYSHFPVSRTALNAANPDFTYGGVFPTPSGSTLVGTPAGGVILQNDEVVAILMNFPTYPFTGLPTVNSNFLANPQKTVFLNANMSGDNSSPGVGTDLVYRDPWGNPYVISLDLADNGLCEDAFYKSNGISGGGLNGLILQPDGNYAFHGKVMVWSAGPDGKINPNLPANQGENEDNVLSWSR